MVFCWHGVTLEGIPFLGEMETGVDLFFVLSGFLIGRIYFRSSQPGNPNLFSFWAARWWRTLPPYYAALALYVICASRFPTQFVPLPGTYLVFAQNYFGVGGFGVSWSLCVEEHFYLLFPLVVMALERTLGRSALRWALPALALFPMLLRFGVYYGTGALPPQWWWITHFHFEGLCTGAWLAYLYVERAKLFECILQPACWLLPVIPTLLLVFPVWRSRPMAADLAFYTLLAVGFGAWLRVAYEWRSAPVWLPPMLAPIVSGLALCSYSIYLTHTMSFELVRMMLGSWHRGVGKTGAILLAGLLVGIVFYFLVERPALWSRDRFLRPASGRKPRASLGGELEPVQER